MARTIGRKNRNLVKRLTTEELEKTKGMPWLPTPPGQTIEEIVVEKLPVEMWDTWEGADSEIRRIILDTVFEGRASSPMKEVAGETDRRRAIFRRCLKEAGYGVRPETALGKKIHGGTGRTTKRTTYDLYVAGNKLLNFDTREAAEEWLKEARTWPTYRGKLTNVEIKPRTSGGYQLGDMWRDDFDYEGMIRMGTNTDVEWGAEKLRKLFDSFEDVNYHAPSSPLWSALGHLEKGERGKAERALDVFRKVCRKILETDFKWYPGGVEDIEGEFGKF